MAGSCTSTADNSHASSVWHAVRMWYFSAITLFLAASALCAHRLMHARTLHQPVASALLVGGLWIWVLLARQMNDYTALTAIGTADIAMFGLGVLAVLRMMGGYPIVAEPGGDDDGQPDLVPTQPEPDAPFALDWAELDRMRASWQQVVRDSSQQGCPSRTVRRKDIPH